jgi:SAM-dependent methyltransferase
MWPWLKRLIPARVLDGQYRRPRGVLGRWVGADMAHDHLPENVWTVRVLDPRPTDRLLEIGFGPGVAVAALAEKVPGGLVAGVDLSATMVSAARRRNAAAIRAGRVDLRQGRADQLQFPDESFDQVFGIHTLYFWPRPAAALRECWRVLRPGGRIVLTVLPRELWNSADPTTPIGTPECRPYAATEVAALLSQAGFVQPEIRTDPNPHHPSNCSILAQRP